MNKQNQFNKKHKLIQQQNNNDDDNEQIEKTLNLFDSILDEYFSDQDIVDENKIQIKSTNDITVQQRKKHDLNNPISNHTNTSFLSSQDPTQIHASHFQQYPNIDHDFDQIPTKHVRRFTSENNLNQIPSSSQPTVTQNSSHSRLVQITTTSTEDLSTIPSSQAHLFNLIDKTNYLTSNNISASLIDLSSIDKLSSRPRFRFVPPTNQNFTLQEEPEIEQQSNLNFDQFHLKTIPSERTLLHNQTKHSHKIVKPTVIIPSVPKSAPITRLTETNIHHHNDNSAFKTHRSNKNGALSKVQQASPKLNIKRTESIHKTGITNSDNNQLSDTNLLHRQSLLDLSSTETSETANRNILGSRPSYPQTSSKFIKYTPQSNKLNGHHHYHHPLVLEDPISRRIQQINNSSSINGLVHPSYNQPYTNGGGNRAHPYGSHVLTNSGKINDSDHLHRQQKYLNPVNIHKYHSSQHPIPTQSVYLAPPPTSRNGIFPLSTSNIYHFNQNNPSREKQSRRNPHRQSAIITTYL